MWEQIDYAKGESLTCRMKTYRGWLVRTELFQCESPSILALTYMLDPEYKWGKHDKY